MKLLADTSAILAVFWENDERHREAVDFARNNPEARFVLTELILGEVATRARARGGAKRAVEFTRDLLRSSRYELVLVDLDLLQVSLGTMERFADKRLSLTDCASFELMKRIGLSAAFTFDRDFRDCGFETVP